MWSVECAIRLRVLSYRYVDLYVYRKKYGNVIKASHSLGALHWSIWVTFQNLVNNRCDCRPKWHLRFWSPFARVSTRKCAWLSWRVHVAHMRFYKSIAIYMGQHICISSTNLNGFHKCFRLSLDTLHVLNTATSFSIRR